MVGRDEIDSVELTDPFLSSLLGERLSRWAPFTRSRRNRNPTHGLVQVRGQMALFIRKIRSEREEIYL